MCTKISIDLESRDNIKKKKKKQQAVCRNTQLQQKHQQCTLAKR